MCRSSTSYFLSYILHFSRHAICYRVFRSTWAILLKCHLRVGLLQIGLGGAKVGENLPCGPISYFFFVFPCAHSLSAVGFSIKETWSELFHLAVCKATKLGGKTAASKNSMPFATPLLFSSLLSLLPNLHITKKLKQSARAFSISCGISL